VRRGDVYWADLTPRSDSESAHVAAGLAIGVGILWTSGGSTPRDATRMRLSPDPDAGEQPHNDP